MSKLIGYRLGIRGAVVAALAFAACTTVSSVTRPETFIPAEHPTRVWVAQQGAKPVLVENPRIVGDTIVGTVGGQAWRLALSDATSVTAERVSVTRSAGLGLASGAALVGVVAFIVTQPGQPAMCYPPGGPIPCSQVHTGGP